MIDPLAAEITSPNDASPPSVVVPPVESPRKIMTRLLALFVRDFFLTLALFIALFWLIFRDERDSGMVILRMLAPGLPYLLLLPLTIYLVIAVHELGHLLLVWLVGYRFVGGEFGPMVITRTKQGLSLGWRRQRMAGKVRFLFQGKRFLRLRAALVIIAGPVASFVLAFAVGIFTYRAFATIMLHPDPVPLGLFYLTIDGIFLAYISMAVGVSSLIPRYTDKLQPRGMSDGLQLYTYIRGGSQVELRALVSTMVAHLRAGKSSADWPPEVVARLQARLSEQPPDATAELQFIANWYLYLWSRHSRDIPQAAIYLRQVRSFDAAIQAKSPGVKIEAAYFASRYQITADAAQQLLAKIRRPATPGLAWLHLYAAVALTAGNQQMARELALAGLACIAQQKLTTASIETADFRDIIAAAQVALVPQQS